MAQLWQLLLLTVLHLTVLFSLFCSAAGEAADEAADEAAAEPPHLDGSNYTFPRTGTGSSGLYCTLRSAAAVSAVASAAVVAAAAAAVVDS